MRPFCALFWDDPVISYSHTDGDNLNNKQFPELKPNSHCVLYWRDSRHIIYQQLKQQHLHSWLAATVYKDYLQSISSFRSINIEVINKQRWRIIFIHNECWKSLKTGRVNKLHLKDSASSRWQLAWCSNWSSSQRNVLQNEHWNTRPPNNSTASQCHIPWSVIQAETIYITAAHGKLNWLDTLWRANHVPKRRACTQNKWHLAADRYRRVLSSTCGHDRPTLHRSHRLLPVTTTCPTTDMTTEDFHAQLYCAKTTHYVGSLYSNDKSMVYKKTSRICT